MGKNTFGVLKESKDAGKYILNKTASTSFCAPNVCVAGRTVASQSSRLILRKANKIYFSRCQDPYNTANLNINLVTVLDLSGVPVIQESGTPYSVPTTLNVSVAPYLNYTIDPSGNLFGNTVCGTDNFQNYLVFNPPYTTANPGFINRV
jgi:hypothetical protein